MKYDLFQFVGANTYNSGARTFFYNAYNSQAAANGEPVLAFDPTGAPSQNNYPEFETRLGATYAFDPATVLRVSYGRYAQAPTTAFEQYNYLQPNNLSNLINFGDNGLPTTSGHDVRRRSPTTTTFQSSANFPAIRPLSLRRFCARRRIRFKTFS